MAAKVPPQQEAGAPVDAQMADAAGCEILPSSFDQSCQVDSDCVPVVSGNVCNPDCWIICPFYPVSVHAVPAYEAALAAMHAPTQLATNCYCPPPQVVCCIAAQCAYGDACPDAGVP